MTDWMLEMRIRVPVDLDHLTERKQELRERVVDLDPRPSFVTAVDWLFVEKPEPADTEITRGASDWMPRGRRHHKMGRGPNA